MTSASIRWVSAEAEMTKALAPGKRAMLAFWPATGAAGAATCGDGAAASPVPRVAAGVAVALAAVTG
ncbi:hypothetical protein D3C71_1958370 [compost metagenome]